MGTIIAALVAVLVISGIMSRTFYFGMVLLSGGSDKASQAATSFGSLFSSKANLSRENADLKRQIGEKENELVDRVILAKENADLKASVRFKAATGTINARVISKPPFTPFDVIVVDAGASQQVKEGDRVMLGQTFLGTVTLVSANSSQVTLLSSSAAQQDAFIGDDAFPVILHGKGGGMMETSLPQGSAVKEGNLVFTYHLQTPFYVGVVSKVVNNEDNTLVNIFVSLPINLYSLSNVEVIPS